jgi:hypothetical protein
MLASLEVSPIIQTLGAVVSGSRQGRAPPPTYVVLVHGLASLASRALGLGSRRRVLVWHVVCW